jgi:fatty acid desaturase
MKTFDAKSLNFQLDPKDLKPLFKTNPYYHAGAMLFNWLIIFGCIYLFTIFPTFWMYFIAIIVIGARMHALAILMHDATHYRFLKNRKWNDLLTNIFTMYPIFTSIEKYRKNHLAHHKELNTDHDPDWVAKLGKRAFTFPKTKAEFILTVASYLVLYQGIMDAVWFLKRFGGKAQKQGGKKEPVLPKVVFYMILFSTLTIFGGWIYFLLFWMVPYLSTFFMFQYIRSVAEHFGGLTYDDLLTSTRTVKTPLLERFIIAPHHVGYHLEHHLYPGVPFYNLPKLHKLLMEQTDYQKKAHITHGYTTGLLNDLSQAG